MGKPTGLKGKIGVYELVNVSNNIKYIGSGVLSERRATHFSLLKHNKHYNLFLQRDYDKYGRDCFQFNVLQICNGWTEIQMRKLEYKYLDLNKGKLYNINKKIDLICPENFKKNSRNVHIYKFKLLAYLAGKVIGTINDNIKEPQNPYTASYDKTFKKMNKKLKERTDKHINEIYSLYNLGLGLAKIGKQLNLGRTTIKRVLKREWNIEPMDKLKDVNGNPLKHGDSKYKPWHKEWLRLFKEEGMILNHIVKKYNVPDTAVAKFLQSSMPTKEYLEICKKNRKGSKTKHKNINK